MSSAYVGLQEYSLALEICDKNIQLDPNVVNSYITKYSILKKLEDFPRALECLEKAAETNPDSVIPISMMAYHYFFNTQEIEKAFQMAEKAYSMDENHLDTVILLSIMYRRTEQKEESEYYFKRARDIDEKDGTVWIALGSIEYELGNKKEGEAYIKNGHRLSPDNIDGLYYLGVIALDKGNIDKAKQYFKEVLDLNPVYFQALSDYSRVALYEGDLLLLGKLADNMLLNFPTFPDGYYFKAVCYRAQSLNEKAITYFQKCIDINPNLMTPYVDLSSILTEEGRIEESLRICDLGLSYNPDYIELICQKSRALVLGSNIREAVALLTETLDKEDNHENPKLHYELASCMYHAKKYWEAYDLLKVVNFEDDETLYLKGLVNLSLSRYGEALQHFRNIKEDSPKYLFSRLRLGEVYMNMRNYNEALQIYDKLIEDEPNVGMHYIKKGIVLYEQGKFEEALEYFEGGYIKDHLVVDESIRWKIKCLKELNREDEIPYLEKKLKDMDVDAPHNKELRDKKSFSANFKPLSEVLDDIEFK